MLTGKVRIPIVVVGMEGACVVQDCIVHSWKPSPILRGAWYVHYTSDRKLNEVWKIVELQNVFRDPLRLVIVALLMIIIVCHLDVLVQNHRQLKD